MSFIRRQRRRVGGIDISPMMDMTFILLHCDFYVYAGNGNRRFQAQGEHGEGTFQGEHPDWHYPAGNYSHQRDPGKPLFVANHFEADDERGSG